MRVILTLNPIDIDKAEVPDRTVFFRQSQLDLSTVLDRPIALVSLLPAVLGLYLKDT